MRDKAAKGTLERLENRDCINQYGQTLQSRRRNVLLVSKGDIFQSVVNDLSSNGSYRASVYHELGEHSKVSSNAYYIGGYNSFGLGDDAAPDDTKDFKWICSGLDLTSSYINSKCAQEIGKLGKAPDSWSVQISDADLDHGRFPVDYCLSERSESLCRLHFFGSIAILITALNFFKACIILFTALWIQESPLMTMGDAVASFLEKGDPTTKRMCLLALDDAPIRVGDFPAGAREWTDQSYRSRDIISAGRRRITYTM